MAISIACEECHRTYKVDDKLAGKKVKCKGCGALIRVPGTETPGQDDLPECLSCGATMAPGNRVCAKCGFNIQTGQKESLLEQVEVDLLKARKKRQYVRAPGSPLLESLDELAKLILTLALVAGIVMTIVHVCRSPDGISFAAILPTIVVLVSLAGIVAPLAAVALNMTVRAMKMAPRDDTYVRMALCMALPYSVSMIAGWPEMGATGNLIAHLGWLLAILLLIYMLRADVLEWIASVVAASAAMALSLIVVTLLGGAVNDIAGGMYADMLPEGPWRSLAKSHSPEPAPPATQASDAFPTTAMVVTATAPMTPTTQTGNVVVSTRDASPATTVALATAPTTQAAATAPVTALRMTSTYFASVSEDPALSSASAVIAPMTPADWMLIVSNTDTTTEVDRWNLNPLEKKEHFSYPYFAKKSPQFAISPKGDAMAALSFFPRRQLEISTFDGKTPRRTILLDQAANIPEGATQAVPSLLGILDGARFCLRWDMNAMSALQIFSTPSGAAAPTWRAAALGAATESSPALLAPNGRLVAFFGRNQITFVNTDGTLPPRPIIVASDLNVRVIGMAFSADSAEIAVYAGISDLPTIAGYQVKSGEPVFTNLLSQTPLAKEEVAMPHALLWLPAAQACLINGNDMVDAVTGKKFASLGLAGVADVQLIGPSSVAFTFKTPAGTPHTLLARLADDKIRAAKAK